MFANLVRVLLGWLAGYAEQVLANRSQGFLGVIGFAKEGTWGTAVGATDYIDAFSENLSLSKDRFDLKNLSGSFAEPDDAVGLDRVAGEIVCSGYPTALGLMLKSAFNTVSGTTVLSGYLYRTDFITTTSEFSATAASQPYTLEIFRDVTSSQQYAGCIVNRLQMAIAPNAPLRLTASFVGQSAATIAKTQHTFPGSPLAPFTFDTCSASIGGAATARLENVTVTVDNLLTGTPALNASALIARIRRSAAQLVTISGQFDFTDGTEYNDFVNQTERAFKLTMTKANSFQFVIEMPRVVYTAFPLGIPGKDRLVVSFEGKARYLTSSALAISCQLTHTKSNW
jgi:hypothetical protein